MKRYIALCLLIVVSMHAKRYKVDGIKVIIHSENDTVLITQSESLRPGLDGQFKALDDQIFEQRVSLDAKDIGFMPNAEDTNRQWEEVKKQNGLSEADMQKLAAQSGYTVQEAKAQLAKMYGVNQMLDFKVRSGLFVSKRDVETYYREHPEFRQAEYYIARAVAPFSDLESKDEMNKRLESFVHSGKGNMRIAWSDPFWLKHDEIAEDKQFIYTMAHGHISQPFELPMGFEMFKLVDKIPEHAIPLNERYDEIAVLLKRPKYQELLDSYKQELYDKTTIVRY